MIRESVKAMRSFQRQIISADLVVTGGGLSGVCCALTAARKGLKVVLVQDRGVLGGNSSSEVRLWVLGATSHMGNNNRWAREGGVIDEILVENIYRNPEGNPVVYDMILLDKVAAESNITLLLNTAVYEVEKDGDAIRSLGAFCPQNQVEYELRAPLFCDASGDGVVGFLAGSPFRMGAESIDEFGERFAPSADYGELLGHSLYFYSKDAGRPVRFVPPAFALEDITRIPRWRSFNSREYGCRLWWIEFGGRLDTVGDTEKIKWELWKIVYGVWNHIKNSGEFPEAANLTLEWVGMIPGKRESRRFEGDYIMRQQDIVEQRHFEDAVAYGGWSIDLHPSDGVFSEKPGCNQWHSKGIYPIPYRSLYSRSVSNLLFAGRLISVSHVAFASTRVMGTGAYIGQAAGMAAVLCRQLGVEPRALGDVGKMEVLQRELQRAGQYIPGFVLRDPDDLVRQARVVASSRLVLGGLKEGEAEGFLRPMTLSLAQLLPLEAGKVPVFSCHAEAEAETTLEVELKISGRAGNFTPDVSLGRKHIRLQPGRNCVVLDLDAVMPEAGYAFFCIYKNEGVRLYFSPQRITGILSVFNLVNEAVSNYGMQTPPEDIGVDAFEFWCPQRRPEGHNLAFSVQPALDRYGPENIYNGLARPVAGPNAWVADLSDPAPSLQIEWDVTKAIRRVVLKFDTDLDHPMESVLMSHPETVMPFCVRNYRILDEEGKEVYKKMGNYQTINTIDFETPVMTRRLTIAVEHPSPETPAAVFEILCYE
ncbi:MAG: FAD-dependent oxidoreductase [Bacteroidetes bacterium]|nr:FAD-dependent oxidoreductase [Bacteroidota bacterium]